MKDPAEITKDLAAQYILACFLHCIDGDTNPKTIAIFKERQAFILHEICTRIACEAIDIPHDEFINACIKLKGYGEALRKDPLAPKPPDMPDLGSIGVN